MGIRILVVDDSKVDMLMIQSILFDYEILCAYDGVEAMEILKERSDVDLMILDLNMPRMDGFEVLNQMRATPAYKKIAVLILTNTDELESEIRGLELGAVDYIRKPLNLESLRKRIEIHVNLKQSSKSLEEINHYLDAQVQLRTKELVLTRNITINALVGLLEARDIESSNHTKRTQLIIKTICDDLKKSPKYAEHLTEEYIKTIVETCPLHDIGKVGIPDNILLKPGKLTYEEFEIMKTHVTLGMNALKVEMGLDGAPEFLKVAIECISAHHERFNGTGYPLGLSGENIPLPGRLMAIADVYDALISKRVYKEAFDHQFALDLIISESGKHFDPEIVDSFLNVEQTIRSISMQYMQHEI